EATEEQAIPDQDTVNRADRVKPDLGDLSGTADFASQVGGPEKPVDNATNNPITYGSGAPTGGSYDDIYIDLTNEDLWFNEGGTWGNRQTNRAEGHKYLSGESVEALKPLEAGATVDTRYGTGNLLGLDSHPTYEQAGLLAPPKHFVGTELQKGTLADFGLAVGDVLTVSADIEVVATVPRFGVFIAFYSVAGSYMGAASSISAFAYTATGSFSRYSGTGAVPAGAVFFKVYTSTDGSGTGFTYTAVRRVMLHRGAVALPYEAASNKTMSGNLLGSDATQERETVGTGYNYEGWSIAGTINTSKNLLTLGLQGGDLFHFGYEFKTVGSVSPYAWIRFYDSAGAVIADYANYRAVTDAPWQYLNMLAHVPAGAAYVAVRATYSGAVPTSLMVRHAVVNTGLHPLPFSEGKFNLLDNVGDAIMLGVGHTLGGRTQHYNNLGRLDTVHGMPANTIAGPSSAVNVAPISAADAGSTATITIGAHTRQFDSGAVSYNAGSILGRSFSTTYYIYCDDATLAGGAVTYVATTDILDIAKVAARVYVGRVYTPANDGTTTYQEPDSGGGELP
ncbi:MAG: hypothetical protein KAI28_09675, partial [Sphingomonadales bacterium]|nr:hypothetical protein [Sphingomonadales bacterium]